MRQIKFRAWDKNQKRWMTSDEINSYGFSDDVSKFIGVSWSQFTGLYDKNGKEIWEGDIVKHGQSVLRVIYEAPSFIMPLTKNVKRWLTFDLSKREPQFVEVLGNLYENPELLVKP